MRAVMVMYDSLNKRLLEPYGCDWTKTPNFKRLSEHTVTFDNSYVCSMPCMPSRREIHTGRANFLHRSWGPIEPYDDSMPEILRDNKVHSHLITDHYHYFEDGGATYHTRYRSYEFFRGQEGDAWKGIVGGVKSPESLNGREDSKEYWAEQDFVNRSYMDTPEKQPQTLCFNSGIEFLEINKDKDNWFLQLEVFDPHEPFFSNKKHKDLYPHDYNGKLFDWPLYQKVTETEKEVEHIRYEYAALLSMCDENLGRILDIFDKYNLWEDTMLIVNTDHGFMLGEHGHWAKCYFPFYNEIANTPLFIWDPIIKKQGIHNKQLVQTIDLAPTILKHFNIEIPKDMIGKPLQGVIQEDKPIRKAGIFGIHGGQINVTDGRYVYMRSPVKDNKPLYQYTLMPTRHGGRRSFIDNDELATMKQSKGFSFTKGLDLMRFDYTFKNSQIKYDTMLFDLENDPLQEHPIINEEIEKRMIELMKEVMKENDCPKEQYKRMGF